MRMFNRLALLNAWLAVSGSLGAQQLFPQTVNTSGQSHDQGTLLLESSIGGLAIASVETGNLLLSQDFLQPDAGIVGSLPDLDTPVLSSAGPNNAGTTFVSATSIIEFTVGEFISTTLSGPEHLLTQGILQPYPDKPVLPITLVDFRARRTEGDNVLLNWRTIQEVRNLGFTVERRANGEPDFKAIAFVTSAAPTGESSYPAHPFDYILTDLNPYPGLSYYRLKQEDTDGTFTYSVIRSVEGLPGITVTIKAWPVPSYGRLLVEMSGTGKDVLQVYLPDGRLMKESVIHANMPQPLYLPSPGVYLLRLSGQKAPMKRVVVK